MNKHSLSKILARASYEEVAEFALAICNEHNPVIVKEPVKTLTMIKMREPVQQSLFYLGEVMVYEAVVEIDGAKGIAVLMCSGASDDADKALNMAIIDAAINRGIFADYGRLTVLGQQQDELVMKENALHLKTMVSFESMDQKAPEDLGAYKESVK
ncbi:MAG: phosphonate C-P lyase system protein PhnG [Coriobacteriia bacterium]|nr:phosphonate C-P lyase system protein PhnG [Coriobacteriia bacterium]